jgi:hypothetical protein
MSKKIENMDQMVSRRRMLKTMGITAGTVAVSTLVPGKWIKPVIDVGMLPAHAQMSQPMADFRIDFSIPIVGTYDIDTNIVDGTVVSHTQAPTGSPWGQVQYERWVLFFDGPTSHLPDPVPVTITTVLNTLTRLAITDAIGGTAGQSDQNATLDFARGGGDSVGIGGTHGTGGGAGTGRPRSAQTGAPPASGTVTLTATGVNDMTFTIQRVPLP